MQHFIVAQERSGIVQTLYLKKNGLAMLQSNDYLNRYDFRLWTAVECSSVHATAWLNLWVRTVAHWVTGPYFQQHHAKCGQRKKISLCSSSKQAYALWCTVQRGDGLQGPNDSRLSGWLMWPLVQLPFPFAFCIDCNCVLLCMRMRDSQLQFDKIKQCDLLFLFCLVFYRHTRLRSNISIATRQTKHGFHHCRIVEIKNRYNMPNTVQ